MKVKDIEISNLSLIGANIILLSGVITGYIFHDISSGALLSIVGSILFISLEIIYQNLEKGSEEE